MKHIYFFGDGKADGSAIEKNLLGGKGANLAEMTSLGIPVPPGLTISTDVCCHYMEIGAYPDNLGSQLQNSLNQMEKIMKQESIVFCQRDIFPIGSKNILTFKNYPGCFLKMLVKELLV